MEIPLKLGALVILSGLSAILYRAGGMGQEDTARPKWIPKWLRHSWIRDWLIPPLSITGLLLFWHEAPPLHLLIASICTWGAMGAALSTYWDWVPFNKGKDNFWMHGFFVGISTLPFFFFGYAWWAVLSQALISAVGMGLISTMSDVDYVEEFGRGFFATIVRFVHG